VDGKKQGFEVKQIPKLHTVNLLQGVNTEEEEKKLLLLLLRRRTVIYRREKREKIFLQRAIINIHMYLSERGISSVSLPFIHILKLPAYC
jgi:hypothetical protein